MEEENSIMKKFADYKDNIEDFQRSIKRMATEMARGAGKSGCHIGGSFSCIEIFSVLYGGILNYDVSNPSWDERDRFIPSKTHCVLSNFPTLVKAGYLKEEDLPSFHKDGGLLAGHPWNVEIVFSPTVATSEKIKSKQKRSEHNGHQLQLVRLDFWPDRAFGPV